MEPLTVRTERLILVAATPASERAARAGREALARFLSCRSTADWPPPLSEDVQGCWEQVLIDDAESLGWTSWYWLLRDEEGADSGHLLVGYGGFKGRPVSGACEVGYSLIESHHRRGLATEATRALVDWAFASPDVMVVAAHTLPALTASIGVLEKLGFTFVGEGEEAGTIRYELQRT